MSGMITPEVTTAEADVAAARRLRIEVFTDEQGIPAHLDDDGLDVSSFHVVCRDAGVVVGTGRLVLTGDGRGVLGRIAVRAEYRGHGLGRSIVQKLESVALAQNLTELSLQPHTHLEGFYQSLGYNTVPGREFVGAHELLTMEKIIRYPGASG